jgi:hypothetical protein
VIGLRWMRHECSVALKQEAFTLLLCGGPNARELDLDTVIGSGLVDLRVCASVFGVLGSRIWQNIDRQRQQYR